MRLPTNRASLAWLYGYCARLAGVEAVLTDGRVTGFTGPKLAIYEYLERMRRLRPVLAAPDPVVAQAVRPAPPPDPARMQAKAQRRAMERWSRQRKAPRRG